MSVNFNPIHSNPNTGKTRKSSPTQAKVAERGKTTNAPSTTQPFMDSLINSAVARESDLRAKTQLNIKKMAQETGLPEELVRIVAAFTPGSEFQQLS